MNHAIKKQSNKKYSSFDTSPPLEDLSVEGVDFKVSEKNMDSCYDESKPLLDGASLCVAEQIVSGETNELNSSIEKEICYDKILPFPVAKKDLKSVENLGVDNLGYDNSDDDIFSSEKCQGTLSCLGKNQSSSISSSAAKDTVVVCNDLDSVCQVLPLSFSPNLYPDVSSVPLINCQASRKVALPSHVFTSVVSTASTINDSFMTVLSRSKSQVSSAASWPRRRPQSLRVAICYSSPECSQEGVDASLLPSSDMQEIGLNDMSHESQAISSSSSTTSFLKSWGSLANLESESSSKLISGLESSFSLSQPDCSNLDDFFQSNSENTEHIFRMLPKKDDNYSLLDSENRSNGSDSSLRSVMTSSQPLTQSVQVNNIPSILPHVESCNPPSYSDYLMSPSSDKENDPALLSVRPKVRQSPRRKKNSPKKKSRSPKKHRAKEELIKQQKTYSSLDLDDLPLQPTKCGSLDDDVWAVDDFLPVPKGHLSSSLPKGMQDFEVCHSPVFKGSTSKPCNPSSDGHKVSPTSSCKDMESSMLISTFSTDTGYETETNKSENIFSDNSTVKHKHVESALNSGERENILQVEISSYSLATPSEIASEIATPMTLGDDLTEFFSITSEVSNIPYSGLQNAGEDTPDYLSICSEMPGGIPRLPEDSPAADLEMNQIFNDDKKVSELSPLDSPESCDPSTLTDSPVTLARSVVEDLDDEKSQENCPTEPTHSLTPSPVDSSPNTPEELPSQELVEVKYVQLSLSIVLAIVLHAMQSISQFMLEIFLATEHEGHWD